MTKILCPTCSGECFSASPSYIHTCPYCGSSLAVNSVDCMRNVNKGLNSIYALITKLRRIQPK